jgi:transcriptional regulator with XRE-family HTH domain
MSDEKKVFTQARVTAALDAVSKLRERREALALSQRQVGELMGLTPKQAQLKVGQWERGDRPPSYAQLAAYAAAVGMRIEVGIAYTLTDDPTHNP